ncbi:hypothetical protein [Streptomyces sp. NPDC001781]
MAAGSAGAEEQVGRPDVLVDNGAVRPRASLPEFTGSGRHRFLGTDLTGASSPAARPAGG